MNTIKKIITSIGLCMAIGAISFAGLAATVTTTTKEITFTEAIDIAKKEVDGVVTKVELDYAGRTLIYEVEILDKNNKEHDLNIQVITGKVLTHRTDRRLVSSFTSQIVRNTSISPSQAIIIAKKETGAKVFISCELDVKRSNPYWEVSLIDSNLIEYEVLISGTSGKIIAVDVDYD